MFVKILDPHHLSSRSLVGGMVPMKGFPRELLVGTHASIPGKNIPSFGV